MFGALTIDEIPTPQVLIDKGYPEKPTKSVNMVLNDAGVIGLSLNGKSFPATEPLVLDEGDEMLRMGFIDDVEWVLEQLPSQRQVVLFSATMPPEIRRISHKYLNDPAEITIKTKGSDSSRPSTTILVPIRSVEKAWAKN